MAYEPVPQARVGSVASPADPKRAWRTAWYAAAAGSSAWMISVNPIVGGLFVASGAGWIAMRRDAKRRWAKRWNADITALAKHLAARELDDADALLRRRERIPTNAAGRGILGYYRGAVCWTRGDLDGALRGYLDCARLIPRPVQGFEQQMWHARFVVANLELELGKLRDAEVSCRRAYEAPLTPQTLVLHVGLRLHHAIEHDRPDELGDAAALAKLVEVARAAKEGLVMAGVVWALRARGDHETAAALAAEARPILARRDDAHIRYPRSYPRLAAIVGVEP